MRPDGFNPMRWDCDKGGPGKSCFNKLRRPKIEMFAECFPRRINFGDVDGLVELNGRFCLLEWKGDGGSLRTGQRLTYEAFTAVSGNIVFVVQGDAVDMLVERYCLFWQGRQLAWQVADLSVVKARLRSWAEWVQKLGGDAP